MCTNTTAIVVAITVVVVVVVVVVLLVVVTYMTFQFSIGGSSSTPNCGSAGVSVKAQMRTVVSSAVANNYNNAAQCNRPLNSVMQDKTIQCDAT
jgi:flagellar basal body-associated protein FliL